MGEDANAKLGRDHIQPERLREIIGPQTNVTAPEKGNGVQMAQIWKQNPRYPRTPGTEENATAGKRQIKTLRANKKSILHRQKSARRTDRRRWKTERQIDYVPTNQIQKWGTKRTNNRRTGCEYGTTKTTQSITNEHMHKTNGKYKKNKPNETGIIIQDDITAMRVDQQKMERWQQQREI